MDMNSPLGKQILALVREADYAHAGEEEAIERTFQAIPKDPGRLLLDVGCGRGATANYIQRKGWGQVWGLDIDSDSISYAQKTYPDIRFMVGDAMSCARDTPERFDIIFLFNVFYALKHALALKQLHLLGRGPSRLIIFDYLLKAKDKSNFPFKEWNPLDFLVIQNLFSASGWRLAKTEDISELYQKWYVNLVSRIEERSGSIIALAGQEWFDFVRSYYRKMLAAIEQGLLGGAIVYADKSA
jgi:SAM-dependent methyltransferase